MASSPYTMLSVALGSRLGLFHKMAAREEPWTPEELAEAGPWKQRNRYQCWLQSMRTSLIAFLKTEPEGFHIANTHILIRCERDGRKQQWAGIIYEISMAQLLD